MLKLNSIRALYIIALMSIGLLIIGIYLMIDRAVHLHWNPVQLWPTISPPSNWLGVIENLGLIITATVLGVLVLVGVFIFLPMERLIHRKTQSLLEEIHRREKMEESLREIHAEVDRFFMLSLDMLCIADSEGYMRRLNTAWERSLGYSNDELLGRRYFDFIHPDDIQPTLDAVATLSAQQPLLNFTNRYRHRDGSYRLLEWRAYPIGNVVYATARDVTERDQKERAKLLADFITNTSHELRTPLTVISSSAYLLGKVQDVVRRQEKLDQINNQVRYLDRMITQLQEMSSLNQIREVTRLKITPCELLERFIAFYPNKREHVEVKMRPCKDNSASILGDVEYLSLALGYLVDNALRYSPDHDCVWLYIEDNAAELHLCVEDHGRGISKEHHELIFQQFYKVDSARTQTTSAAGMGLTMARRIMELHGGRVSILSHHDKATVFALTFPKKPEAIWDLSYG